jgi:hypothetical protein
VERLGVGCVEDAIGEDIERSFSQNTARVLRELLNTLAEKNING